MLPCLDLQLSGPDSTGSRVFRGLRVRMGINTGVAESDVQISKTSARVHFAGAALRTTKAVSDAAQGGMVLLSASAFKSLAACGMLADLVLLNMGEHELSPDLPTRKTLYQVLPKTLLPRCAFIGPTRTSRQILAGVLDAPLDEISVVFLNVVGYELLMQWDQDITQAAIDVFQDAVVSSLSERRGYVVEMKEGSCIAAFADPASAVLWAVHLLEDLKMADWPPTLLQHELCETITFTPEPRILMSDSVLQGVPPDGPAGQQDDSACQAGSTTQQLMRRISTLPRSASLHYRRFSLMHEPSQPAVVLMRGLRLKVGIDMGPATGMINPVTGRMDYKGRVLNRAARISAKAASGKVWVSDAAWRGCTSADALLEALEIGGVMAQHMGAHELKGVATPVDIWAAGVVDKAAPPAGSPHLMTGCSHLAPSSALLPL